MHVCIRHMFQPSRNPSTGCRCHSTAGAIPPTPFCTRILLARTCWEHSSPMNVHCHVRVVRPRHGHGAGGAAVGEEVGRRRPCMAGLDGRDETRPLPSAAMHHFSRSFSLLQKQMGTECIIWSSTTLHCIRRLLAVGQAGGRGQRPRPL